MISPTSFADVLAGGPGRKDLVQNSYSIRILKKLKPVYGITSQQIGYLYDQECLTPLDNIKYELDNQEFKALTIKHIKEVRLITMLRNPKDTAPWKMFIEGMRNEYTPGYSGVIFPILNGGDFIIHNLGSPLDTSFDHAKIIMQSRDSDLNDLVIEPLDNFIAERKRRDI